MRGVIKFVGIGIVLALVVAAAVWIGVWIFESLIIGLTLSNQPAQVTLPAKLSATARVSNVIDIGLDGKIETTVPLDMPVVVPFSGEFEMQVAFDIQIPVAFTVNYDGDIPVDTMASLKASTQIDFGNVKTLRNLSFDTEVPLKFDMPVSLSVPIEESIRFQYQGPISVVIDERLDVNIKTELPMSLHVNQQVSTPITSTMALDASVLDRQIDAEISHAELKIRAATLQLEEAENNEQPNRQ